MEPAALPEGISGSQLTAFLEGYSAAAAWTHIGEAFGNSSLGSVFQVSFYRGFEVGQAELRSTDATASRTATD